MMQPVQPALCPDNVRSNVWRALIQTGIYPLIGTERLNNAGMAVCYLVSQLC